MICTKVYPIATLPFTTPYCKEADWDIKIDLYELCLKDWQN